MASSLWLFWATLSLCTYALWGVFNALASKYTNANTALFCSSVGYFIIGAIALAFTLRQADFSFNILLSKGAAYGLLVGMATGLGGLFLLVALHKGGHASVVIALTSIYPLATVVFNLIFLHEAITVKQIIGIISCVVGVCLLSI